MGRHTPKTTLIKRKDFCLAWQPVLFRWRLALRTERNDCKGATKGKEPVIKGQSSLQVNSVIGTASQRHVSIALFRAG
jgi:hypothetical protein